jgi:hypothetical protein
MTKQLKIIYFFSIFPLLIGSLTFFYWFYKRTWFADNANIESLAFFTILGFLLFALISIILCLIFVVKNLKEWKKIIIPILIIAITVPVIDLYATLHNSLSQKVFVRIINDTDNRINRIWSDNFEITSFKDKGNDFVISFYPVYTYDWTKVYYSDTFYYEINRLKIDLKQKGDSIITYDLPSFSKGDCQTIKLTEIINKNK